MGGGPGSPTQAHGGTERLCWGGREVRVSSPRVGEGAQPGTPFIFHAVSQDPVEGTGPPEQLLAELR